MFLIKINEYLYIGTVVNNLGNETILALLQTSVSEQFTF